MSKNNYNKKEWYRPYFNKGINLLFSILLWICLYNHATIWCCFLSVLPTYHDSWALAKDRDVHTTSLSGTCTKGPQVKVTSLSNFSSSNWLRYLPVVTSSQSVLPCHCVLEYGLQPWDWITDYLNGEADANNLSACWTVLLSSPPALECLGWATLSHSAEVHALWYTSSAGTLDRMSGIRFQIKEI